MNSWALLRGATANLNNCWGLPYIPEVYGLNIKLSVLRGSKHHKEDYGDGGVCSNYLKYLKLWNKFI